MHYGVYNIPSILYLCNKYVQGRPSGPKSGRSERDFETFMRLRDFETTRFQDYEIPKLRDSETTRFRNYETTKHLDYQNMKLRNFKTKKTDGANALSPLARWAPLNM